MRQIKKFQNVPLSVLDLVPITEGSTAREAFQRSVELAQHVERWGFNRYWLAEHHNMPGIGSSATSVLIAHIAGQTKHIRVGAGGIMLPNHAPLVIAEQFGTLESLFPGRIDLGLGRAPGTDQVTAYALRRTLHASGEDFPMLLEELLAYFDESIPKRVNAYPGVGLDIPVWLLGSSGFSAQLAAYKGLPFSFASHFSPQFTLPALQLYREKFKPSLKLKKPYVMLGINVIAADTEEKAKWLASSQMLQFLNLSRGMPTQLKPPVKDLEKDWSQEELMGLERTLDPRYTIVGSPETVAEKLSQLIRETEADELIIHTQIYHHEDRLRSYEIVSELMS